MRIVAPSGPVNPERFENGVALIEAMGFKPVYDTAVLSRDGFLAGSDERRLEEFQDALKDASTRAIWAARGGYGATRLLPNLAVEDVRRSGKWLIGFSDITALHGLWRRAGLRSVHGANVTSMVDWSPEARAQLEAILSGELPPAGVGLDGVGEGAVEGSLAGGNLCVLCALIGTPYFPDLTGTVVLLEDVNEPPYRLDRYLTQMEQAGVWRQAVGIAVGQLTRCDDRGQNSDSRTGQEVLREHAARTGLPMVLGLPHGHESNSVSALLGARVKLDPKTARLSYLEDAA